MALEPLRIGTAGWSVPSRYAAEVPPGGSHLERYARRLNAVEINSSFYRPHQHKTYARWAQSTPPGFRFAVKVPKAITHESRLADCGARLDRFVAEVAGLGDKLGVLLVQLPPSLAFRESIADAFFDALRARTGVAVALEPRHASWFAPAWAWSRTADRRGRPILRRSRVREPAVGGLPIIAGRRARPISDYDARVAALR